MVDADAVAQIITERPRIRYFERTSFVITYIYVYRDCLFVPLRYLLGSLREKIVPAGLRC